MNWFNSGIIVNIYYASISELVMSVLIISALFFVVDQGFRRTKERIYRVWHAFLCLLLTVTILIIFYFTLYGREQVQATIILIPFYSYYLWLNGKYRYLARVPDERIAVLSDWIRNDATGVYEKENFSDWYSNFGFG